MLDCAVEKMEVFSAGWRPSYLMILLDGCVSVLLVCFLCCGREGRLIVLTESWGSTLQSWLLPGWLPPWVHTAAACWPAWQLQLTQSFPASLPFLRRPSPSPASIHLWPFPFSLHEGSQKSCKNTYCFVTKYSNTFITQNPLFSENLF